MEQGRCPISQEFEVGVDAGASPWADKPFEIATMPAFQPLSLSFWQSGWFQIALLCVCGITLVTCLSLAARLALQSRAQFVQLCDKAREVSRSLDEVVWAVNSHRDTLRDFTSYVCKYAQAFFDASTIRCRLDMEPEMPALGLDLAVRRNVFLAVKEALPQVQMVILTSADDDEMVFLAFVTAASRNRMAMVGDIPTVGAGHIDDTVMGGPHRRAILPQHDEIPPRGGTRSFTSFVSFIGNTSLIEVLPLLPLPFHHDLVVSTVFLLGDSTVTDQPHEPWNSWGQMLTRFFQPGVAVANHAESGESLRGALSARRVEKVLTSMRPGDYLFVQFGHNDMKDRATNALATYRTKLHQLIADVRDRGGTPVLVTSMERKAGVDEVTLGEYPRTVRGVAEEAGVALIDLHAMSRILYRALGDQLDAAFQDGTHHNAYGSYELARCVALGIWRNELPLARSLVPIIPDFDPAHPDDPEQYIIPASPAASYLTPDGN
jgi:lysophospholipase L1-like esterase